jgi:hypothetical protein
MEGILSAVIWPNHAGAVNRFGDEPLSDPDYQRGQITWGMTAGGVLLGNCRILVPMGTWTHIVYGHRPDRGFTAAQKLSHPMTLSAAGVIDLDDITEADIRPLNPDRVLHD